MEKKDLKPAEVFMYFEKICQVPRPSKKEGKIIAYLQNFGKEHGLETRTDKAGNVLIRKPATRGMEQCKTVALQAHMDMVCEKNNDVQHDFLTDPIETEIDGEWIAYADKMSDDAKNIIKSLEKYGYGKAIVSWPKVEL